MNWERLSAEARLRRPGRRVIENKHRETSEPLAELLYLAAFPVRANGSMGRSDRKMIVRR